MFEKLKRNAAVDRRAEEVLYETVLKELQQGHIREGLWAKALANSDGSDDKAKSLYIGYRVQSIKDDAEIISALVKSSEETSKQLQKSHQVSSKQQKSPARSKDRSYEDFKDHLRAKGMLR